MIRIFKNIMVFLVLQMLPLGVAQAQALPEVLYPCSVVLRPLKDIPNAQGVALITKLKKPYSELQKSPVREREGISIYADWLPSPSTFGDYDLFEGFVQIPGKISWRFKMYPVKEDTPSWFGGTPWVGKFSEISLGLPVNTQVEVHLFNSKTNKLGPVILQNSLNGCST